MGQYFGAYTENPNDKNDYHVYSSPGFLKLMEHSWFKNDMVSAIMAELLENPRKVAWIGDYSTEGYDFFTYGDLSYAEFCEKYNRVFPKEDINKLISSDKKRKYSFFRWNDQVSDEQFQLWQDLASAYIINHSRKCYISLEEYAKAYREKFDETKWIVHPLPLYTACGNGQGGGDFSSKTEELLTSVGSWAFDIIEVVYDIDKISTEYKNVSTKYLFFEE